MILIIAEKPSLARNIVSAIGNMKNGSGFYYSDKYIVTWAFGHLFSLSDIEDYAPNPDGRWSMKNIPCFPEKFMFRLKRTDQNTVDPGVEKQYNIIKTLCERPDVDTVVNAGDSDREGEIIIRICVMNTNIEGKSFKRLWLPDQTTQTIQRGLAEMKDETEYDNLANEGYARTFIDWLYGVNLTRFATLKTGRLLRVGRVIVPIVKAIYDRDMQIRHFVPEKYYSMASKELTKGEEIELLSKEKFDKNNLKKAEEMCRAYNNEKALVVSKKKKKDTLNPGKLYSLTKLQNVLGKKYKMSMEKSLSVLQGLYEKGYVTYPRTNSEYLATAEQDKVKAIIEGVKAMGYPVEFKFKKTIFDDSKIESHSALTPTYKIPKKESLTPDEVIVYSAILKRFVAVFCSEECVAEKNEIKIKVGEFEEFILKGTVIVEKGWTKYDDYNKKDKILPNLDKGDEVNILFKPIEKETTPPKHYTIETLNNYLKNPFKEEKQNIENEDDEEEYKAIFEGLELGTEATRTGIINNARKSNYIELKKDVYKILPEGEFLIESLARMNISMDKYKTSELGKALKKVYRGEMEINDSVHLAENEIREVFGGKDDRNSDGFMGDIVAKCPRCGADVVRSRYGYTCAEKANGCDFHVNNIILGKVVSIENLNDLIQKGKTQKISGFVSKRTGNKFDAYLKYVNGNVEFEF